METVEACPMCGSVLPEGAAGGICPTCFLSAGLDDGGDEADSDEVSLIGEEVGDQVGRYFLLERIAEGGFGVVFRAEQRVPVRRVVALKVIKPGMDTKEVIRRFELERQALALMDHPNIARVYDAGTTSHGRPYFVMEFVDGEPLTKYCDRQRLDLPARLRLFAVICKAVQHAHQKGIIHRDLKPSNILVRTGSDGNPVPKVIDFGVAKAISMEVSGQTFFTVFGRLMGTPRYMAPEQAELNAVDVDTRCDVYSLGVLLYELITGSAPLRDREMNSASFDKVRKMILEKDPVTPSMRILEFGEEERREAAEARQEDTARWWRHVKGDLDWIVMKALAKDRERRYDTAHAFAADIRRHLRGLPVVAGPPSTAYRFGKFVRRNRWPVAVGVLSLVTLIAVIVVLWLWGSLSKSQRLRAEINELSANVAVVKGMLDSDSWFDFEEANDLLGEVGNYSLPKSATGEQIDAVREIKNDARDQLIALLFKTGLDVAPYKVPVDDLESPIAVDPTERHCAIIECRDGTCVLKVIELESVEAKSLEVPMVRGLREVGPLVFDSTGDRLALGVGNEEQWSLHFWEPGAKQLEAGLGLEGVNQAFAFAPDGGAFAIGSADGKVTICDAEGDEIRSFSVGGTPLAVAFSQDGHNLAVSHSEGIEVVTLMAVEGERVPPGTTALTGWSLAWSPNGESLVVGGDDGSVSVLRSDGKVSGFGEKHAERVDDLAWSSDGLLIASGSRADGVVRLWDSRQGELLTEFAGWARGLRFYDNDRLGPVIPADKGSDETVCVLHVKTSPVCDRVEGHDAGQVEAAAWDPEAQILATGAEDGVRLWNREGTQLAYSPELHPAYGGLAWWNDYLYIAEPDGIFRFQASVSGGRLVGVGDREVVIARKGVRQIVVSERAGVVAAACGAEVLLINLEDNSIRKTLSPPAGCRMSFVAVSPKGDFVAAGPGPDEGATVRVWSLLPDADLSGPVSEDLAMGGASTLAFYPLPVDPRDRQTPLLLLVAGDEECYRMWKYDQGTQSFGNPVVVKESGMKNVKGRLAHIAFSPRGTALVVSRDRTELSVWNPLTFEPMTEPYFDNQWPLVMSPKDGHLLVTEANKGRLFIWDLQEVRAVLKKSKLDWPLPDFEPTDIPVIEPEDGAITFGER